MRESELLKRFISELKANLKEVEENLLPRISEDMQKLKANRNSPYYDALLNSLGKNLQTVFRFSYLKGSLRKLGKESHKMRSIILFS